MLPANFGYLVPGFDARITDKFTGVMPPELLESLQLQIGQTWVFQVEGSPDRFSFVLESAVAGERCVNVVFRKAEMSSDKD